MATSISTPSLLGLLRSTLERIESDPEIPLDDPAAVEFRRTLMRSIAELELQRAEAA